MIERAANKLQLIGQPLFVSRMSQKFAVNKAHFNVKARNRGVRDFWCLNIGFVGFNIFAEKKNKHRRWLKDSPLDSKKHWPIAARRRHLNLGRQVTFQLLFHKTSTKFCFHNCVFHFAVVISLIRLHLLALSIWRRGTRAYNGVIIRATTKLRLFLLTNDVIKN